MLKNIWNYRYFILFSIKRDVVGCFSRSRLGALWIIFNPLAQTAMYALILSNVLSAKLPGLNDQYAYPLYLMSGSLGWALFSNIITRSVTLFTDNANLLKKISFPKITLSMVILGSCLFNNFILLLTTLFIFYFLSYSFHLEILYLIPLTITLTAFSFGIGLILGIFNVFIRDLSHAIPILLQVLFWFTPIVYPAAIIPSHYQNYLKLNPIFHFVEAYHSIILYGTPPSGEFFLYLNIVSFAIMLMGVFLLRRASPDMVDVL